MATIDFTRVAEKLDTYFDSGDLSGAERLLLFWRDEALSLSDKRGVTQIDNELLGLYRRTDDKEKALRVIERLLPTLDRDNVGDATVKLNIATDYCHFGDPQSALPLFREVEDVYSRHLAPNDYRMASLYNNMASYACAVKDYVYAETLYQKALHVMRKIEPIMPEVAVTYVNLAVSIYLRSPLDSRVDDYIKEAYAVLLLPHIPHDGNFAFVLSKVMPVFAHLGYREELACLQSLLPPKQA